MRLFPALATAAVIGAFCLWARGQAPQAGEAPVEATSIPPRASPADYLSQAQAGTVTIAAEFKGHSIPTLQGTLSTEDYVVVEVALFGPPGARLMISSGDFSLRINKRKVTLPSQPYGFVVASVKDPEREPPSKSKSKTGLSTGGEQGDSGEPERPAKVPIAVQRAWAQRVQKAALPEGDRALPQAGLLFFEYRGKAQGIRAIELIYSGAAGKASLALQP
jgi:hypothetical protein